MLTRCLQNVPLIEDWIDLLVPKLSYLVQHRISVAISCYRDICSCSSSDGTTVLCPA